MSEIPVRLQLDPPGRDGRLYVGFERAPKGEAREAIKAGCRPPLDFFAWYGRAPLVMFYCHDKATEPSGRFDEGISQKAGERPTRQQVAAFDAYVREWIRAMHAAVPVVAAWGWSGRLAKVPADPAFARAWLDVIAKLGKRVDGVVGRRPDRLLQRVVRELDPADRPRAEEVLATRRAAWGGTL